MIEAMQSDTAQALAIVYVAMTPFLIGLWWASREWEF